MTLTELQAQRTKVLESINGLAEVSSPDAGAVVYKDAENLRLQLAVLDGEIAKVSGGSAPRVFTVQTERGL